MWVHEMTDEQKREYGFFKIHESTLKKLGYKPVIEGWKAVEKRGDVRVWQGGEIRVIRIKPAPLP
ncbi:hypothetical protein [Paenibacillus macerans]|uniref:hypothetical protein n=1 Tax=Paenibacillus macerans TaxID=44252 RepID=UPI00203F8627|nr:hypothetical protein [Paenibacillus macerans]MCM3701871.1 hypothetical protein [Paenibacillus macerans]